MTSSEWTSSAWTSSEPVCRAAKIGVVNRAHGPISGKRYMSSFDSRLSSGSSASIASSSARARCLVPLSRYNEYDEPLPTEAALGHLMMTAGLQGDQYFWCNICSAYTGDRVRKLAKQCDRVTRYVPAVHLLRQDRHPTKGTLLSTPARRVVKADVGLNSTCCEALPCAQFTVSAGTLVEPCAVSADCIDVVAHPPPFFLEDGSP